MNRKSALVVLIFLVAAVTIVVGSLYFKPDEKPTQTSTKQAQPNFQSKVETQIKTTFNFSKDKDIITYLNLASKEKSSQTKYSYFVKAYQKMLLSYNQTKDPAKKAAILNLRDYLTTFAEFKPEDLEVPK